MPRPTPAPPVSEIIPRLYIGDLSFAESASSLSSLGITHILSAMRGNVDISASSRVKRLQIPLDDLPFAELAGHLPDTTSFIREAMAHPDARVLVHCVQGVSRSASVVAAYLMALYGWSPTEAVQYVKSRRMAAEPNAGFVMQLHEWEQTLRKSKK
jgi:protein-tyrosine phosphatase